MGPTPADRRPPSGLPGSLAVAANRPMVGRAVELATLGTIWELASEGPMAAVLIGGEAGAGKTRLAAAIAADAAAQGAWICHGPCDRALSLPFQPWVPIVEQLVDHLEGAGVDVDDRALSDLSSIVPSLADRSIGSDRPTRHPEEERFRAVSALVGLLDAATSVRPVVMIVDDLHWAGAQSLAALAHLIRVADLQRLVLVGTFRDTSDEITEPLASTLADLRRSGRVTRLALGGLDADGVRELLGSHVSATGNQLSAVARDVRERTGGNPFLVIELCRNVPVDVLATAVPDAVVEVIADRLRNLSPAAVDVAAVVAVVGRASLQLLGEVLGADRAASGAGELVGAGLVDEVAGTIPTYQYSHALLQDAVRERIGTAKRASIHLGAAEAIERITRDLRSWYATLTEHYLAAAPLVGPDPAVRYGRLAAHDARSTAAYEEAVSLLDTVAGILPTGDRDRISLLTEVVELVARSGQSNETGLRAARTSVREAADADHDDLLAEAAIQFERLVQHVGLFAADAEAAVDLALERCGSSPSEVHCRLLASRSRVIALQGRPECDAIALEALAEARSLGDADTMDEVIVPIVGAIADPHLRLELALELADRYVELDDPWLRMWGTANAVAPLFELGRLREAWPLIELQRRLAARYRFGLFEYQTHVMQAALEIAEGRLDDAAHSIELTQAVDSQVVAPSRHGIHGLLMFLLHRERDELEVMRPVLAQLSGRDDVPGVWLPGFAASCAHVDMHRDAERVLRGLVRDGIIDVPFDGMRGAALALISDAVERLGLDDLAPTVLSALEPHLGGVLRGGMHVLIGPADACAGAMAALCGRAEDAANWFERAALMARQAGAHAWVRRIEASHRLAVARAAGDVLPQSDRAPEPAIASPDADGLSARELEVLRCLASGRSNRQIGQELFISSNTVANHVRAILRKTGCSNRTEAAAHAIARGIAGG